MPIARQFLSFALIGAAAFFIDAGVLTIAHRTLGLGLYGGRVISFLCAATFTWSLNRRYTFRESARGPRVLEWLRFLGTNSFGGAINFSVYAALVACVPVTASLPVIAVAAGSVAGLVVNFSLSRALVFRAAVPSAAVDERLGNGKYAGRLPSRR